jgi:hypothetical protein
LKKKSKKNKLFLRPFCFISVFVNERSTKIEKMLKIKLENVCSLITEVGFKKNEKEPCIPVIPGLKKSRLIAKNCGIS